MKILSHAHSIIKDLAAWVLIFVAFFVAGTCVAGQQFNPVWNPNQAWQMNVEHRRFGSPTKWSAPIIFKYRMGSGSQGYKHILVSTGQGKEVGKIFFDHELRIWTVELWQDMRGKTERKVLHLDQDCPIRGTGTIFPYDWPIFPLRIGETMTFTRTIRLSGGLTAKRNVTQEVQEVSSVGLAGVSPILQNDGPLIRVQCRDGNGDLLFVQYWAKGLPWPLCGENPDMRYWLVSE